MQKEIFNIIFLEINVINIKQRKRTDHRVIDTKYVILLWIINDFLQQQCY